MYDISSATLPKLEEYFLGIGEKKYRAAQVFRWLHKSKAESFAEMTDLPESLREKLQQNCKITSLNVLKHLKSKEDETQKFLFALEDGERVETVLMKYVYGTTICVSTQVGCKMGCAFCASTKAGFVRNLTAGEIAAQMNAAEKETGEEIGNLVLMGIGEPLDNFDNVCDFLEIIAHKHGRMMSPRRVKLSTCGLADKIIRLGEKNSPSRSQSRFTPQPTRKEARLCPSTKNITLKNSSPRAKATTKQQAAESASNTP